MDKFSYLSNTDVSAVEELYQNYLNDPKSVDEGWAKFSKGSSLPEQIMRRTLFRRPLQKIKIQLFLNLL